MRDEKELEYLKRLEASIPGGSHTYSKGADQYPDNAPVLLSHGKGAYVFDMYGKKYLDFGMGLKSVILGYNNKIVTRGAIKHIKKGNNLSKPSLTELNAAEKFLQIIPNAEMVKFAKNGSNVTTAAVKLARSVTGKKYVCVPDEQPFFSFDDWFIGKTQVNKGIPEEFSNLTLKFNFNNIESLRNLFEEYKDEIAAVMLEPATHLSPCSSECPELEKCSVCPLSKSNFLHQVQELCKENDALLIFDEMRTGFRWSLGGAQEYFNIKPDISTFGKSIANGFSLSALAGKKEILNLANINEIGMERTFLLSSTHGAEMGPLGAFMATAQICEEQDVSGYLWKYGQKLKNIINETAIKYGINAYIFAKGPAVSFEIITLDSAKNTSMEFRTLLLQELVSSNLLMTFIAPSFSHGIKELEKTATAFEKALGIYSQALNYGLENYLQGAVIKPVFRKFN